MNRRSRKTRDFPRRLAALLLCAVCLFGAVSVSATALEANDPEVTEETTAPSVPEETAPPTETEPPTEPEPTQTETTESESSAPAETEPETTEPETTAPQESETTTEPTERLEEETTVSAESEETTVPEAEQEEPEASEEMTGTNAADALFERLMACDTYEAFEALLNSLTEDELLLLEQLTEEQNAALQAKMEALTGGLVETLATRSYTIMQGETQDVTVDGISNYSFRYSCSQSGITAAYITGGYRISVAASVPSGTYTLSVSYYVYDRGWNQITDTVTVTVTAIIEAAQVYYLKTPTSSPDSNDTSEWGRNIGNGSVKTDGATWTNDKNIFSPGSYVVSMPSGMVAQGDGSWLLPKDSYSQDYTAIYTAYKAQLEKELGVTLNSEADIEAIYLTPYKISKNNGTTPDKHIDCKVSVKTSSVYAALFWVTMPDGTVRQVDAKNYKKDTAVKKTDKAPTTNAAGEYPETMVVDGVTYRFVGWRNEARELLDESRWDYTPNETELADGTVNFYAEYVPATAKLSITKTLSGNMYNANDTFEFTVVSDGEETQYTLGKDQTVEFYVSIGANVTITEASGGYTYSLRSIAPDDLEYADLGNGISFTMPNGDVSVVINNEKNVTVDTGVPLDSVPFVLIFGFAGAGVLLLKKRCVRGEK